MTIKGIVISDIHIGRIDDNRLLDELEKIFFKRILNMSQLDIIVIDGDYYDHKLFLNSRSSTVAMYIMNKIVDIASMKNSKIRVVYGTESHEVNQYNIFNIFETDELIDFKIIRVATEEEIFPGINVLYLPEELIKNKKEYYDIFFNNEKKYDFIFGHGIIREVMTNAVVHMESSTSNRPKPAIFSTAELNHMRKGLTFFGHYHINTNINDNIFYVGSFTRWQFGEEEDKGYYEFYYDGKSNYSSDFVVNDLARRYKELLYDKNSIIYTSYDKFMEEIEEIDKVIRAHDYDFIKLSLEVPENCSFSQFISKFVKEKYNFNRYVRINIKDVGSSKRIEAEQEEIENSMKEYSYIFDKNIPIEEKISRFVKNKMNVNVPINKTKQILYGEYPYEKGE